MKKSELVRLVRDLVDRGVAHFLSRPGDFVALVREADRAIGAALDPERFGPLPDCLMDEFLRRRRTDILHRAFFRKTPSEDGVWIHCVLEHQSRRDRWMPQRFHHVRDAVWETERREWDSSVPPRLG